MTPRQKAYLIISGSILFLIALVLGKFLLAPKDVCDPEVKSKTVILIDHSEAVASQTTDAIVDRVWEHIDKNVPSGELVSIYKVTAGSKQNLKPAFVACKPRSKGSQITENAKRVKLDFDNFQKKLREELSLPIVGSNESPIAQAITDLSLDVRHFQSSDVTKLLVFSDFMENTDKFSLYRCMNPDLAIQKFRSSRAGAKERPEFKNVEIQMHLIPRPDIGRDALSCRTKFWNWFFGDTKGSCKKEACLIPVQLPG